jgi:hypothetical protein
VDYGKAFDSVEIWSVLESLQRCQVDWRYPSDEMPVGICLHVRPSTESANKTDTIASRSETRGRHLPETVHKCNAGCVQDAELDADSLAICR